MQIASIQTLTARELVVPDVSLFVYDECHHGASEQWQQLALSYKNRGVFGIGLTATPVRADGLPLEIYDDLVCPISMRELIDQGYLVPFTLERPPSRLKKGQLAQRPVDAWNLYAKGRKTIVFATNVLQGTLFRDEFRDAGVTAEMITGETPAGERAAQPFFCRRFGGQDGLFFRHFSSRLRISFS